jgi:hypothetical protein
LVPYQLSVCQKAPVCSGSNVGRQAAGVDYKFLCKLIRAIRRGGARRSPPTLQCQQMQSASWHESRFECNMRYAPLLPGDIPARPLLLPSTAVQVNEEHGGIKFPTAKTQWSKRHPHLTCILNPAGMHQTATLREPRRAAI